MLHCIAPPAASHQHHQKTTTGANCTDQPKTDMQHRITIHTTTGTVDLFSSLTPSPVIDQNGKIKGLLTNEKEAKEILFLNPDHVIAITCKPDPPTEQTSEAELTTRELSIMQELKEPRIGQEKMIELINDAKKIREIRASRRSQPQPEPKPDPLREPTAEELDAFFQTFKDMLNKL